MNLFEGMAGWARGQDGGADGVSVFEWAEGFSGRAECDQFRVPFRWEEVSDSDGEQCFDWSLSYDFDTWA